MIAFAQAADSGVHGHDQRGESCFARTLDRAFRYFPAPDQIKLIPGESRSRGFNVFKLVPGNGGENVSGASLACSARGGDFPARVHHAAVTNRSKHRRERNFASKHGCAQLTLGHFDGLAWPERDAFKSTAIFT